MTTDEAGGYLYARPGGQSSCTMTRRPFGFDDETTRRRNDEFKQENGTKRRVVVFVASCQREAQSWQAGADGPGNYYLARDATQFVVEPPDFADPSIRSPLTCPVYSVFPAVNVI